MKPEIGNSLQKLHIDAFDNQSCSYKLPDFEVKYSFHYYCYNEKLREKLIYFHSLKSRQIDLITYIDDALSWSYELRENAYLFELLFNTNIVAVNSEMKCILEQNVDLNSEIIDPKNFPGDLLALKIMLLNHGVHLSYNATLFSQEHGDLNYNEFEAVDMVVHGLYVNVPFNTMLTTISPFEIDIDLNNNYILMYWGEPKAVITLRQKNPTGGIQTKNGFCFDDITYLGNDRLRVYHRNSCYFKMKNLGCKFCDIPEDTHNFSWEDIKTAIDAYSDYSMIRHYLIGGGVNASDDNFSDIIYLADYIRKETGKPISLMSTPPYKIEILETLQQSGITEVIFNLEMYDRKLAKKYMPGKGCIPIEIYEQAFKKAVTLWGRTGNVRSMFILGLEPKVSLFQGIEFVCRLGVSPTLSIFKPIPKTPLENLLPPSNSELLAIYNEIEKICKLHNVTLGPSCKYCEDNVLKVTI